MSEHTRFVHEVFYWIEIAAAPLVLWLLYRMTRYAWPRGWLGDDWPDPPALDADEPDSLGKPDLTSVAPAAPAAEPGEPVPWRR